MSRRLGFTLFLLCFLVVGCGGASTAPTNPCESGNKAPDGETLATETDGSEAKNGGALSSECDESCREKAIEDDGFGNDEVGWLTIGMNGGDVEIMLGPALEADAPVMIEATGLYATMWRWPGDGVEVEIGSSAPDALGELVGMTISAPSAYKTRRGVGIGSSEAEVVAAYDGLADPNGTRGGESFVAGSLYSGVFFTLADGKVSSIFIGAGAE